MKIIIGLGALLFTCGASLLIYGWVYSVYVSAWYQNEKVKFAAILLMVIPIIVLISWVIWKVTRKL